MANKGNPVASAVLASRAARRSINQDPTQLALQQNGSFDLNQAYKPLPRPAATFTQGDFGPLVPMVPAPVDQPRDDTGRPDPRRTEYPMAWNLPGVPGSEGLKLAPFATLRAAAETYSVARACVDHRINEIVAMGWDIVPTAEAVQAMKGDPKVREDWERRRSIVVKFFESPDSDVAKYPTFESWLSALLEERFVIDAVAVHMHPTRRPGAGPFGSSLASLDIIDGATIRPLYDIHGNTPAGGAVAYQQYIWGVPRADFTAILSDRDVEDLPEPTKSFTSDQLIYLREHPRLWTPYGFSCVEKSIRPITLGLMRQAYQLDYFQEGSVPAQFITPGPEIATPQQILQLQNALNAMAGDIGAKHRVIVLPPGSKADPQKTAPLADQFDEWIVAQVTMNFMLTPMDVGVTPRVSAVQSPSESKQLSQINTDKGSENRIQPVITKLKADLFDFVIQRVFKQQDMEWSWGITSTGDRKTDEINSHIALTGAGLEVIDEARVAMGLNPFGLPETSVPLVRMATGVTPLTLAVAQSAQALAAGDQAGQQPGEQSGTPDDSVPTDTAKPKAPPAKPSAPAAAAAALTTPAHEAIRAATSSTQPGAAKEITAELEKLQRFLRKGKPLDSFQTDVLTDEAMDAARGELPKA